MPVAFTMLMLVGVPRIGVTKVGDVARTTLPDPVVPSSPSTPELLYSMSPLVPANTLVVPTVILPAEAEIVQVDPSVQVWPFTVVAA